MPRCPKCNSTNVVKLSEILFDPAPTIFEQFRLLGKRYVCNNCGHKFR